MLNICRSTAPNHSPVQCSVYIFIAVPGAGPPRRGPLGSRQDLACAKGWRAILHTNPKKFSSNILLDSVIVKLRETNI